MLRVLHITKTYFPETVGGIQEVIRQIVLVGQASGDIQIDVFCLCKSINKPDVVEFERATVYRFPVMLDYFSTPVGIRSLFAFRKIASQYDVIHYHYPWPLMGVYQWLLSGLKKKIVVTYHCDALGPAILRKVNTWICHRVFSKANDIVATSPNIMKENDFFNFQRYQDKVRVIPLGLDEGETVQISDSQLMEYQEKFGSGFVFFIGQFRAYKGPDYILEAAQRLPQYMFLCAGSGVEFDRIKDKIEKNSIDNIKLLGRVSDEEKVGLIKLSKLMVLPSITRAEAFGVVSLESMMYGKPVISTELGTGTSFVNKHKESGLVISPRNTEELCGAIKSLYSNGELYETLSVGARERFEHLFRSENTSSKYLELYVA